MNAILKFYGGDPLVAWLLTASAILVLAALVYIGWNAFLAYWRNREIERAARQREHFAHILRASTPPEIRWPPSRSAKGGEWRSKRKVS